MRNIEECKIKYETDTIELRGDVQAIHIEAGRILRRFANSLRPYEVETDTADRIVLMVRA